MFRLIGLAEEAGSGVATILNAAASNKLPKPQIDTADNRVSLSIKTTPLVDYLAEKYNLDNREFVVLKVIHDNTILRRTDIQELTGLSRAIVLNSVSSLLEKGVIVQVGQSSATKYTISNDYLTNEEKTINVLEKMLAIYKK